MWIICDVEKLVEVGAEYHGELSTRSYTSSFLLSLCRLHRMTVLLVQHLLHARWSTQSSLPGKTANKGCTEIAQEPSLNSPGGSQPMITVSTLIMSVASSLMRPLTFYILASVGISLGKFCIPQAQNKPALFHASILVDTPPKVFCSPPPPCPPLVNGTLWLSCV